MNVQVGVFPMDYVEKAAPMRKITQKCEPSLRAFAIAIFNDGAQTWIHSSDIVQALADSIHDLVNVWCATELTVEPGSQDPAGTGCYQRSGDNARKQQAKDHVECETCVANGSRLVTIPIVLHMKAIVKATGH